MAGVLFLFFGCSADDSGGAGGAGGGDSDADLGDGGCVPATQPASSQCASCVESLTNSTCQQEAKACDASKDCVAIRDCAKTCGTFLCLYGCIDKNKAGESAFISWKGCVDTGCHDPCHCTGCRLFQSSPCHECVVEHCESQCFGCDKNAACMAAMYCRYFHCADPNTQECWDDCTKAYPGSADLFLGLVGSQGCLSTNCSDECGKDEKGR